MKANYTKPLLVVDMFSAVQSVAKDCTSTIIPQHKLNTNDAYTCYWDNGNPNIRIFAAGGVCNRDGEAMQMGCYNNPTEENFVFRS